MPIDAGEYTHENFARAARSPAGRLKGDIEVRGGRIRVGAKKSRGLALVNLEGITGRRCPSSPTGPIVLMFACTQDG